MNRIGILVITLFFSGFIQAQDVVNWSFSFDNESNKLMFSAEMEDGWHIYSLSTDEEFGPVVTSFQFEESDSYKLKGNIKAPEPIVAYDPNFGGNLEFYEKEVVFYQDIKIKASGIVKGSVTYMRCNDEMCYPPKDVEFEINIINE